MIRALVLAVLVAATGVAAAEDAEALYQEGQAAYDAKNYDAALSAWKKSYELSKLPALLFNIAQAHRLRGDCADAIARYKEFIAADPRSSERGDAEGFIKDLDPTCPKPIVTPVKRPATDTVVPVGNSGRGKRVAGYVVGGAGIAIVVVGAVFGTQARSIADEVKTDCADGCSFDAIKAKDADGRAAERNQYIAYGVGGAAVVTGGILYWLGARDREAGVTVTPRAGGASIVWTRRW